MFTFIFQPHTDSTVFTMRRAIVIHFIVKIKVTKCQNLAFESRHIDLSA